MAFEFKKVDIDGRKIQVYVASDGKFTAELEGANLRDASLDGLVAKLRKQVRVARAAIPISMIEDWGWSRSGGPKITDGVLTGVHGGNGNPLVKRDGDTRSGYQPYAQNIYRRLTKDEKAEYTRLDAARSAAAKAVDTWEKERRLNIHEALAAAGAGGSTESET